MACVSINALWAQLITCQKPRGTYVLYNVQHTSHGGRKQGVWEVKRVQAGQKRVRTISSIVSIVPRTPSK